MIIKKNIILKNMTEKYDPRLLSSGVQYSHPEFHQTASQRERKHITEV